MAQVVIGLDIGTWSIKAAVLETRLRGYQLVDFREHHIPRDPAGEAIEVELDSAVARTLEGVNERNAIVTAIPGKRVLVRELELPFTSSEAISSVLAFQLEGQVPVPVERLLYDHYIMERRSDGARVLVCAVERTVLTEFLKELEQAGANPRVVSLDALVYGHLAGPLQAGEGEEPVAFLDLGHTTTSVCVVRRGRVELIRAIARGGHHLTLAVMRALGVDYGQAETIKHALDLEEENPADPRALDAVAEALTPLVREIRTSLHVHAQRSGQRVERAEVFGGTSRLAGLTELLADGLALRCERPRLEGAPFARLLEEGAPQETLPKATALALRFIDGEPGVSLNFRQGDLAYESDFKAVRDKAVWLVAWAVVIVGAFFGKQFLHAETLEQNHERLATVLEQYTEKVLGDKTSDFDGVLKRVSQPPDDEGDRIYPELTAFKAFVEVTAAQDAINATSGEDGEKKDKPKPEAEPKLPEDGAEPDHAGAPPDEAAGAKTEGTGFQIELKKVVFELKKATVEGEASNIEAIEKLVERLKTQRCFQNVDSGKARQTNFRGREGWFDFTIKMDVGCTLPKQDEAAESKEKG
jgi:type IV pilus assembly protein PilM